MAGINGHGFANRQEDFRNGIQVVDSEGAFGDDLQPYLKHERILSAGFNYHLISVFGSQSTGKSTLLNALFGTNFGVMNEEDRRQTTKGIWLAKSKDSTKTGQSMAENILVMDVEGTDGQERGEDQDFERKSALFALATSEVLLINMFEQQVGLYHGANMGLLKTVFEVNLELFVKGNKSIPRSLLFFVIRDHTGRTPLSNLRKSMLNNLTKIWASISKPSGLEHANLEDYFDVGFAPLPHKLLQPEKFDQDVNRLATRFREARKNANDYGGIDDTDQPLLLPDYHRHIPLDGFPAYSEGLWEQIMSNKDLDLPTQQELLAQFRCGEIARECILAFDEVVAPLETQQANAKIDSRSFLISNLGSIISKARQTALKSFETEASRYHKGVYQRQLLELTETLDARLKILFQRQLEAASKLGLESFTRSVTDAVKAPTKPGTQRDFASIVEKEKSRAVSSFEKTAQDSSVQNTTWSVFSTQLAVFKKDLDQESKRLRHDEMRRLATRIEKWIKSQLDESVALEYNKIGSGKGNFKASDGKVIDSAEFDHWDRVWSVFTTKVSEAEKRFSERAITLDASADEADHGLWRLRRLAWGALKSKVAEESAESNLGMKLRENFEDRFKYDEDGVPKIWRPTDDIDGLFARARDQTLKLIPLLARFRLSSTSEPPPLDAWIGQRPASAHSTTDDEELEPIGGVDDADHTLQDETLVLSEARQADATARFRKVADGVYVEAKRGALGGVTQVPYWMWGLLLVLGQNEAFAVLRNPFLILLVLLAGAGVYITYQLNLWGPIIRMTTAAWDQGLEVGKERLREMLANSETGRQAIAMEGRRGQSTSSRPIEDEDIPLHTLQQDGKKSNQATSNGVWD